jgi:hypothetical protein
MRPITIAEVAILCGRDVRTVGRALADAGVVEIGRKGRAVLYDSALAFKAIYRSGESARERLEVARAETAEMDLAQRRGELLAASDVAAARDSQNLAFRARILSIPSKIAGQFAPPGKLQQAEEALTSALHEALSELAGDGPT